MPSTHQRASKPMEFSETILFATHLAYVITYVIVSAVVVLSINSTITTKQQSNRSNTCNLLALQTEPGPSEPSMAFVSLRLDVFI